MSLIPPHGGKLIDRIVKGEQAEKLKQEAGKLPAEAPTGGSASA